MLSTETLTLALNQDAAVARLPDVPPVGSIFFVMPDLAPFTSDGHFPCQIWHLSELFHLFGGFIIGATRGCARDGLDRIWDALVSLPWLVVRPSAVIGWTYSLVLAICFALLASLVNYSSSPL